MKSLLSKKCSFIFSLLSLSLFVSCGDFFSPDWGTPAKEFFKEYTETSAVMQLEYDAEFPKNKDGIVCIPCNDDHSITFYLRNPQNYTLAPHYEFKDSFVSDIQGYTFVQDAEDKSLVKLSFTKEFLRTLEDRDSNDLSGTVSLYEPKSGRVFDHFEVSLHANSAPPEIKSPCFQLSDASDGEYVVCFYFPKLFLTEQGYNNPLHRDNYQFIVNGHTYYIKAWEAESPISIYENYTEDESGPSVSNPSSYFTTTAPTGLTSLRADGFVFDPSAAPDGYVAMYYLTGQQQSPNDIRYTFTIRDREGLSNSIAISNKAQQLNPPNIQVASNQSYAADEYTGRYTLSISHDGLCTDGSSCGAVTIHYTITDSTGRTTTGSANGSARISLASGTYTISSYATKDYYIASESVESTSVKIFSPAIYYVSNQGRDVGDSPEDEPTGAITDPFRTINHALEVFRINGIVGVAACEIRLLTDITPTEEQAERAFEDSEGNALIYIPPFSWNPAIFIRGYNGKRTIDAKRNETISGRVIYNVCNNLTLENLVITGGYAKNCTDTYAEQADGGAIYSQANISLTDCVIQNNISCNAYSGGGAIYVDSGNTLTMTRCTLSNNEACLDCSDPNLDPDSFSIGGGAIYAGGDCTLTDCTISENIGQGALVVDGILRMKGGKVTNNKATETYLAAGIYMSTGILDGVEISGNYFAPTAESGSFNGGGVKINNQSEVTVDPSEPDASVIIRNCTIKNNKANSGAGVCYEDASSAGYCLIENTTITQNTSYMGYSVPSDVGDFAAGIYVALNHDKIKLRGTNIITGNTLNDGKAADLKLSEGKKLIIGGSLGKSKIGIYMPLSDSNKPTPGTPFAFTQNYAIANSSVAPGEYFIAENGLGIAANTSGEASFAVSGGSLYSALDYRVSVSSSQSELKTVLGKSKTYTFKVSASRKEEDLYYNRQDKKLYLDAQMQNPVNDEKVNWSAALFSGGYKVSDLEVTTSASGTPELSITVPAQSFEDTYTLKVYANYMGITTDSNFTYSVKDP
ncbi:MAG TPA: hypothetical protein DC014_05530 [Treponema sp.]|nr:hypothetical protein [Treponema sp.]